MESDKKEEVKHTYIDKYCDDGIHRIIHLVDEKAVASISAGELDYRLEHALKLWDLSNEQRATVQGWLNEQRRSQRKSKPSGLGSERISRRR